MKISVIHPSFKRPELAAQVARKWFERAKDKTNFEYILSLTTEDPVLLKYHEEFIDIPVRVHVSDIACLIPQVNKAAAIAEGDIFVVIADDTDCPENWDQILIDGLAGKSDFTCKTKDGIQPFINTMQICDRVYYNRFGYIFYHEYQHMFCDTEFTCISHMLGKTIYLDVLFQHLHFSRGHMERDETNDKNESTWGQGQYLFDQRKANNFGLNPEEIVASIPDNIYTYNAFPQ